MLAQACRGDERTLSESIAAMVLIVSPFYLHEAKRSYYAPGRVLHSQCGEDTESEMAGLQIATR